jgi:hypothetical protein
MKRKYKQGDWIRIPLDASYDAVGVIARACRSRLFGYFFGIPSEVVPSHDDLKRLRAQDAAACALFGGAPLEDARWEIVATSVPFDRSAWPFPQFASRGAFGRTWSVRTYDPESMQTVRSDAADAAAARELPDARFAVADELEALLRERICGVVPSEPLAIYEAGEAVEDAGLQLLERGGRLQFGPAISDASLDRAAAFIAQHPEVELRVHGGEFDLQKLRRFSELRFLILEVQPTNGAALPPLQELRRVRIGQQAQFLRLEALAGLPDLRELEVRGANADLEAVRACPALESLTLVDTPPLRFSTLASAPRLREIIIAHGKPDLREIGALPSLARLELRSIALGALPDLSANAALRSIVLRNVRGLRDLTPLMLAPALRELRVEGMPQLHVWDFKPLAAAAQLRSAVIDVASRRKSREIYRLLRVGKRTA